MLPGVVALRVPPGKLWLYACGDVHLRFPVGGTAKGTEIKAFAPLGHVVPTSVPNGSSAVGAAPTRANEVATTERERRKEYIFEAEGTDFELLRDWREKEGCILLTWDLYL
jgi:hypothetical protein